MVIEGDKEAEKQNDLVKVSKQAYNAIQLFMHFFPKTELDGASRLTICVCKKPEDKPIYFYDSFFKISIYYVGEETLLRSQNLQMDECDQFYLELIEAVLLDISKQIGKMELEDVIKTAVQKVKEARYSLLIKMTRLSKRSKNRTYAATVFKHLQTQGELDFVEILDQNDEKNTYVITDGYVPFPLEWYASQCEWEGNRFVLKDRLGGVQAYIDADKKTMYSIQSKNRTNTKSDFPNRMLL